MTRASRGYVKKGSRPIIYTGVAAKVGEQTEHGRPSWLKGDGSNQGLEHSGRTARRMHLSTYYASRAFSSHGWDAASMLRGVFALLISPAKDSQTWRKVDSCFEPSAHHPPEISDRAVRLLW